MAARTQSERLAYYRLLRDAWDTAYSTLLTDMTTTGGAKPSYSVGGQSVSWPDLYKTGLEMMEKLDAIINRLEWSIGGPVDSYRRA